LGLSRSLAAPLASRSRSGNPCLSVLSIPGLGFPARRFRQSPKRRSAHDRPVSARSAPVRGFLAFVTFFQSPPHFAFPTSVAAPRRNAGGSLKRSGRLGPHAGRRPGAPAPAKSARTTSTRWLRTSIQLAANPCPGYCGTRHLSLSLSLVHKPKIAVWSGIQPKSVRSSPGHQRKVPLLPLGTSLRAGLIFTSKEPTLLRLQVIDINSTLNIHWSRGARRFGARAPWYANGSPGGWGCPTGVGGEVVRKAGVVRNGGWFRGRGIGGWEMHGCDGRA